MSENNRRDHVLNWAVNKAHMVLPYLPMKWWTWTSARKQPHRLYNYDYLEVMETKRGFCIVTPHRNLYISTPELKEFLEDLRAAELAAEQEFIYEVRAAKKEARF